MELRIEPPGPLQNLDTLSKNSEEIQMKLRIEPPGPLQNLDTLSIKKKRKSDKKLTQN